MELIIHGHGVDA